MQEAISVLKELKITTLNVRMFTFNRSDGQFREDELWEVRRKRTVCLSVCLSENVYSEGRTKAN